MQGPWTLQSYLAELSLLLVDDGNAIDHRIPRSSFYFCRCTLYPLLSGLCFCLRWQSLTLIICTTGAWCQWSKAMHFCFVNPYSSFFPTNIYLTIILFEPAVAYSNRHTRLHLHAMAHRIRILSVTRMTLSQIRIFRISGPYGR